MLSCVAEKDYNSFYYDFGVDGKNNDILKIVSKNKNKRLNMDGLKVLEFAIKRVPETISNVLKKVR